MLSMRRLVVGRFPTMVISSSRAKASLLASGVGAWVVFYSSIAHCEESSLPSPSSRDPKMVGKEPSSSGGGAADPFDPIKAAISEYYEYAVNQLGVSGCVGVCCGIAFKRIGKGIAFAIGLTFTGLQALSYFGYIKIDYNKVARDANKVLDVNGDGKLDGKDIQDLVVRGKTILGSQLPSVGGFCSGFAIGLYFG